MLGQQCGIRHVSKACLPSFLVFHAPDSLHSLPGRRVHTLESRGDPCLSTRTVHPTCRQLLSTQLCAKCIPSILSLSLRKLPSIKPPTNEVYVATSPKGRADKRRDQGGSSMGVKCLHTCQATGATGARHGSKDQRKVSREGGGGRCPRLSHSSAVPRVYQWAHWSIGRKGSRSIPAGLEQVYNSFYKEMSWLGTGPIHIPRGPLVPQWRTEEG